MNNMVSNKKVLNLQYVEEGDYFVMTFNAGFEFAFRFMSDLEGQKS